MWKNTIGTVFRVENLVTHHFINVTGVLSKNIFKIIIIVYYHSEIYYVIKMSEDR